MKKTKYYLTEAEWRFVIHSLNELRTKLIKELEGVIFLNIGQAATQDETYVTADEYLLGNIREKLEQAKAA